MVCHVHGSTKTEALEFITGHNRPDRNQGETPEEQEAREQRRLEAQYRAVEIQAEREREREERLKRDEEAVAAILERALPFPDSYAERYMKEGRGVTLPKRMTRDLRFVLSLDYFGYPDAEAKKLEPLASLPAMVALIRNPAADIVGLHLTYLDPEIPRKWRPIGDSARNKPKKFRKVVEKLTGSMIRLGVITETLVIGEGIETTGAFFQMGLAPDDASFGVAMSLGNLCGGSTQTVEHRSKKDANGNPSRTMNGIPDPAKPGVILPEHVRSVILLGDGDSDQVTTRAALLTGARRYANEGRTASICMADPGADFNDMLKGWRG